MGRYALLLRGVNVGTKNSLPMAELRAMLERSGATSVKTYVQSGNAVFEGPDLTQAIEAELAAYMGRPIATTFRTKAELEKIVANNPFPEHLDQPNYLCVTFFRKAPKKDALAGRDFSPEVFAQAKREIYTWHPAGQGRSALAAAIGKLGGTTRNWNTVTKLLAMLGEV